MKEGIQPIGQYGQRIRTLRERHQLDQNTLAALTETTPEMIQRIESSIAHPSFSMIERLARVLHVPSDHLITSRTLRLVLYYTALPSRLDPIASLESLKVR